MYAAIKPLGQILDLRKTMSATQQTEMKLVASEAKSQVLKTDGMNLDINSDI